MDLKAKNLLSYLFLILNFISTPLAAETPAPHNFTIGALIPLTGDTAEYGVAVRNGFEIARTSFPDNFKNISFAFDDNRYEAKSSISGFQKLKAQGVDFIYSWGEIPFNALASVAEKSRFPLFALSLDNTQALHKKYVVRVGNDANSLISVLIKGLAERGIKKLGIIKTDDPYIEACVRGVRASLPNGMTLVEVSSTIPSDLDMRSHALRAKSASVDALGVYLYPGQISAFYRALKGLHLSQLTFGTDIFESRREIADAGEAMEGALYPNFAMPNWFSVEYQKRFGNDAQIAYAYSGYAFAAITGELLKDKTTKLSAEDIITLYKSVKGTEGDVTFKYRETADGDHFYEFPVALKKITRGGFDVVKTSD